MPILQKDKISPKANQIEYIVHLDIKSGSPPTTTRKKERKKNINEQQTNMKTQVTAI